MKKAILFTSLVLLCFAGCYKTKKTPVIPEVVGIWQLCATVYDNIPTVAPYETERLPQYKIVSADGTFTNMILSRNTYITVYGTYCMPELGTYIEHVEKSYTNPLHNDYENTMECELINGKYMKLSYPTMENSDGVIVNEEVSELWVRVPCGNPFETASKEE